MKCENCTKKECIKKSKIDDQQNVSLDIPNFNSEHEEKNEFHKLADAKIFLSDCLASDSCVTVEEGIKVFQQNQKEFFRILNLNKKCDTSVHKVLAVSICPQSLPYFAAKFNLSVTDASKRLCGFLKSLGWIQYAERVLGNPVTPHICTAKSPQQIMGSLVKDYFARQQNLSPDKIFHIIVAPCYDKKLEALREDFYTASYNSYDVDCVLTSGEIIQIMEQKKEFMKEAVVDTLFGEIKKEDTMSDGATRSDGYLEHIFKYAAKELFDMNIKEITYKALKNKDFQEITLEKNGEIMLRFAAAYGFRNIQNMVLKLKKGKFPYHFVEVLACPGGCLNGKGQTQTEDGKPDKALLRRMEEVYAEIPVQLPETNTHVQKLYQEWLDGTDSPKVLEALHTTYSSAEPPTDNMDIKW
ncbi:nuclear prelamin A recognition factor isoform X2 [Antechinus flavipes]|uniref:nuclear prelamin A recognition factor isoform X2 n=1 Tax=Antechinus flavipes TaxID=38775 RepID=UPI00223691DF|nr:nuclear prelamin A recognition factor isoform X2 [Antechinus flavipes]